MQRGLCQISYCGLGLRKRNARKGGLAVNLTESVLLSVVVVVVAPSIYEFQLLFECIIITTNNNNTALPTVNPTLVSAMTWSNIYELLVLIFIRVATGGGAACLTARAKRGLVQSFETDEKISSWLQVWCRWLFAKLLQRSTLSSSNITQNALSPLVLRLRAIREAYVNSLLFIRNGIRLCYDLGPWMRTAQLYSAFKKRYFYFNFGIIRRKTSSLD